MAGLVIARSEHIEAAIARVPGLTPKERRAVCNVMLERYRDLSFVKLVMDQTPGWSKNQDEGRVL